MHEVANAIAPTRELHRGERFSVKVVTIALLGLAPLSTAKAQQESARAVADSFFAATAAGRWERAAGLLDLQTFARQLRQQVNFARSALPQPPVTAEVLMARDTTLPRAVAEWQVQRFQRYTSRPFHDFSEQYFGITTFRALEALSPEEGAVRWLEAQDPGARWRRYVDSLKCPEATRESLRELAPKARIVLGVVEVNDSTAWALTSNDYPGARLEDRPPPSAVLLRRLAGEWRMVPGHWLLSSTAVSILSERCPQPKPR